MKQTKKTLLLSAVTLLICISMLIGSTFAWFTDQVTSFGNKIQSGSLKVDLELLDKATGEWNSLKTSQAPIFNYDKWEPGYIDTKILKIENEGNLALKWVAKFYSEKQLSILADVIDVYVLPSNTELAYPTDRSLAGYTHVGTLSDFINSIEETTNGTLEAKQSAYLGIALKMQETAGNEYQALSLGGAFDIRIFATQHTSEFDSFNNIYDILAGESVVLTDTMTLTEYTPNLKYNLSTKNETIANVTVPKSAVEDPTKPVTVVFESIDPTKTIDVGENTKAYAFDISITNLRSDLATDELIRIVVAAPKGLPELKVYHNGVLIPDAVYDEVAGTITFKTASFSPFAFTYTEVEASSLEELRAQVAQNDRLIKLTADLEIDLTKNTGKDRSPDHVLKSGSSTYYNAVNINSQNIAIDLNGHKITVFCGGGAKDNSDVGALFFVNDNGSLNIVDNAGGGYIKMASSIYAVWAPYNGPCYVDIYSGIFIADSYAGDPIGTPVDGSGAYDPVNGTMKNENTNRSLIYAGKGGNINIRGGYFLYNNTPNDNLDRNNGAFNCKDHLTDGVHITIHGGVMLINNEYRQNPANTSTPNGTFDNISIKLAEENGKSCTIEKVTLDTPMNIDGNNYGVWYKVTNPYKYKLTYMKGGTVDEVVYVEDNSTAFALKAPGSGMRWIDNEGQRITFIPAGNIRDVVVYEDDEEKYIAYFVNKDGEVIYSEEFRRGQSALNHIPEVPEYEGYIGIWENYDLSKAEGSIVIKPVYTDDPDAGELFELDINALFAALGRGESLIMSQTLEGSQGNASNTNLCEVTNNSSDKDAKLNLNGYELTFEFSNPSGKQWNMFTINGDSTLTLTSGVPGYGTLKMTVGTIKNGAPNIFILESGGTLELGKGVTLEFHYPAGKNVVLFNVEGMTQEQVLAKYPNLQYTNENGVMRLVVLEDTTIIAP